MKTSWAQGEDERHCEHLGSVVSVPLPGNLKPLLVCLVLQFVQQWCGVYGIMFKTVNFRDQH